MNGPHCDFCHFRCRIGVDQTGRCTVRGNHGGRLVTEGYGHVVSLAVDPVEKKPLYHVQPGTMTLSVALFGCNLHCKFCQNASISQPENRRQATGAPMNPEELADRMLALGLGSVSFTYSEPTVWQDWMLEAARAVKDRGGRCFMITNGSFSPAARGRFGDLIDAYNIDVKGDDAFYRAYCGGRLEPVMDNVVALCADPAVAVEVCTLVIEGVHTVDGIVRMGTRLAGAGLKVWHLSRFFPAYRMQDHPATSERFLDQVFQALRGTVDIPFVYAGNSSRPHDTHCPACGSLLIQRGSGRSGRLMATSGQCPGCDGAFTLMN